MEHSYHYRHHIIIIIIIIIVVVIVIVIVIVNRTSVLYRRVPTRLPLPYKSTSVVIILYIGVGIRR